MPIFLEGDSLFNTIVNKDCTTTNYDMDMKVLNAPLMFSYLGQNA